MTRRALRKYLVVAACVWTALILASGTWNARRIWRATRALALGETRTHVAEQRAFNRWVSELGSVYARVSAIITPSPHLRFHPERDLRSSSGGEFTLVSPHRMLSEGDYTPRADDDTRVRLTSLQPVDTAQSLDAWERDALRAFETGRGEVWDVLTRAGRPYLRLMKPLHVEPSCLSCHGRQNYRVGDIRGGLEAWTDLRGYHAAAGREIAAMGLTHGLFWGLGLAGLGVGGRRLVQSIAARERAEEERRSMEARLQHAQRLESLGILAGGVAHGFNNALTAVLGNTSLALERLEPHAPARPLLEKAQRAALRAAHLTNLMLSYAGEGPQRFESVDLNALVRAAVAETEADWRDEADPPNAIVTCPLADELPRIVADPTHVRLVVMNLLTNAYEALAEQGGTISVSTGARACDSVHFADTWGHDSLPAGNYAYVEVLDTGHGMDDETLVRIFEPFYSTKFTGRGLGLSAVLGIVRSHRGAIRVQSEPGVGSLFRVYFPCPGAQNAPTIAAAPP